MKLKSLLTGAACAALLTGAASAYDLVLTDTGLGSFSASGDEVISDAFVNTAIAPSPPNAGLAAELDFSNGVDATFHVYVEQTADGIFTTDDVLVTVNLTNGEFESPVGPLNLDSACSSGASLSSDGGAGDTTATFLISGIDGCDFTSSPPTPGAALGFALPIEVDGAGALGIEIEIVTDSGQTPVDGGSASIGALNIAPAFDMFVTLESAAAGPIIADLDSASGPYIGFESGYGCAGGGTSYTCTDRADFTCNTNLSIDLAGTPIDCTDPAQLVDATWTATGDMTAFDEVVFNQASPPECPIAMDEQSATCDLDTDYGFLMTPAGIFGGGQEFPVFFPDGTSAIEASAYVFTGAVELGAMFSGDLSFGPFDLTPIVREGTIVDVAWVADRDTAIANGTTNMIRISNLNGAEARVFAQPQNATNPAYVDPGLVLIGAVPANGELMYDSDTLTTAIGAEWGRADITFTIEGREENLTLRHMTRDGRGADAELGVGDVADDLDG